MFGWLRRLWEKPATPAEAAAPTRPPHRAEAEAVAPATGAVEPSPALADVSTRYLTGLFARVGEPDEAGRRQESQWLAGRREQLENDPDGLVALVPRLPTVMPRLMAAVNDPARANARELATLIESDPVITAAVLKVVNSPAMRIRKEEIDSLEQAILVMGFAGMREAIAAAVISPIARLDRDPRLNSQALKQLWPLSLHAAVGARKAATRLAPEAAFDLYLAALIHNSGLIALLRGLKDLDSDRVSPALIAALEPLSREYSLVIAQGWGMADRTRAFLSAWARGERQTPEAVMLEEVIAFMQACALKKTGGIDAAQVRALWRTLPDYAESWFEEGRG